MAAGEEKPTNEVFRAFRARPPVRGPPRSIVVENGYDRPMVSVDGSKFSRDGDFQIWHVVSGDSSKRDVLPMPRYCQRTFDVASATALIDNSEAPHRGHTIGMHQLPPVNPEGFLRQRLAAPPVPGVPAPDAVCGFFSKPDIVHVVMALLNSDRGQLMLGIMDDGGVAGHVCEDAAALQLPGQVEFGGIARAGAQLYVRQNLIRAQLYARSWRDAPADRPPFYIVTCFPTERAAGFGIDDWGDGPLISGVLQQLMTNVEVTNDNTNGGLRQRAELYALWLSAHLTQANVEAMPRCAVAKVLAKRSPADASQATPMRPYYAQDNRLRAPVGVASLSLALSAQGYTCFEEQHRGTLYLMARRRN